jgi:hypothetical protein
MSGSGKKEIRAAARSDATRRRNELIASAFNSPREAAPGGAQSPDPAFAPVTVVQAPTPWFIIAGSVASVAALALVAFVMLRKKG